jgi:IS5 family transposase
MWFCGLGLGGKVLDVNTLWDFREALIKVKVLDQVFEYLHQAITAAGYLPIRWTGHQCHVCYHAAAAQ